MEPKIVELGAFTVVGLRYFGDNKKQEIRGLWEDFGRNFNKFKHIKENSPAIGLCVMLPGEMEKLEYVAGMMVDSTDDMDPAFVSKEVPPSKYAVFTHKGTLYNLGETYNFIFSKWVKDCGYEINTMLNFEWYDDRFKDNDPNSEFDIYVPIK
jgi:AraC family transcriptional regulator